MAKSGQARVLTDEQQAELFAAIQKRRYPEKNTAIMRISFCLGLRVQEIALLEIKEVARLLPQRSGLDRGFVLNEILSLPASYTKGANAVVKSSSTYNRTSIRFKKTEFDKVVAQIVALTKAGAPVIPADFYPDPVEHNGKARDLPMVNENLREALQAYLEIRIQSDPTIRPTSPLFLSQKNCRYTPNALQEHMALMLREWAGIEKGSSHSGRRTVLTKVIKSSGIKVAQTVAGHRDASTTVIYDEPGEAALADSLKRI